MVLYSGEDTKIARNSVPARSKMSDVERQINYTVALIFVALLSLCTASVVLENAMGTDLFDLEYVTAGLVNGTPSF